MQQNTPPQAPICHRTPPSPPRRRVRSRKLVCAACWVTPSLAQEVAAPPLFAHADLRAARFAFSAAGELGACASPVCPRLLRAHVSCVPTSPACWAAAFPLAVDRRLDQFRFPGSLSDAASGTGARVFRRPRAAGGPAEARTRGAPGHAQLPVSLRKTSLPRAAAECAARRRHPRAPVARARQRPAPCGRRRVSAVSAECVLVR